MKHTKVTISMLMRAICCGLMMSAAVYATDQQSAPRRAEKTITDDDLQALIVELYTQAEKDGIAASLPADFKSIYAQLQQHNRAPRKDIEQALLSLTRALTRAVRPDAPQAESAIEPVAPFICDLTQILRLLGIIRIRVGTTDDSACKQSILGILGNACEILGPDSNISIVIKEIKDLIALLNHCPVILEPEDILPNGYTITNPGYYTLCGSIGFDAPVTATCIIRIAVSNVTLDLNQHTLYQVDASAGLDGICIENNVRNVVVQNGKVSGLTSDGITVGNGCRNISLRNLTVRANGANGIDFNGTTGTRNQDFLIECVESTGNGARGLEALATDKVQILHSKFNNNTARGIFADDCNVWQLVDSQASANSFAGEGLGVIARDCNCWRIKDSDFSSNSNSAAGGAAGFLFQAGPIGVSGGHEIDGCVFCNNMATSGEASGLDLQNTHSCIIKNSSANGNVTSSGTARGFLTRIGSSRNLLEDCSANGNSSITGGDAEGFRIADSFNCVTSCDAIGNAAAGGTARGVQTDSAGNAVQNCRAISNAGSVASHGFRNTGVATNFFAGNFSFGHALVGNYVGTIGFVTVASTAQPGAGSFDERKIDNISVI